MVIIKYKTIIADDADSLDSQLNQLSDQLESHRYTMNIVGFTHSDNRFTALIEVPTTKTMQPRKTNHKRKQPTKLLYEYKNYLHSGTDEPMPAKFDAIVRVLNEADDLTRQIIELYYLSRNKITAEGVAMKLSIGRSTLFEYKSVFLDRLSELIENAS